MADNTRAINRVFTRGVINDLLQRGSSDVFDCVVDRHIKEPINKTHGELFSEIYSYLGNEYRNEYYYMNTLLNKQFGIHSVTTTTALSQVRIGQHIADFVMINGEGRVYEIKSNLDNFSRLGEQLSDYFKAFSKVSVLTTLRHEYEKISALLEKLGDMGQAVGIYLLKDTDEYFSGIYRREPEAFNKHLDHTCIFKLMRKREYENVVLSHFRELPKTMPVHQFRACLEWFTQIPIVEAQSLTLSELKKRNTMSKPQYDSIKSELRAVVYFSGLSRKLSNIEQLLQATYRG